MRDRDGVPEDAMNFRAPKAEKKEEQPGMYEFGGEYGGETFNGVDFAIFFPPSGGELWTLRIDAGTAADPNTVQALRDVLAEKQGGEVIQDMDRGEGAYFYKGDPRAFIRDTLMPEARKKLQAEE